MIEPIETCGLSYPDGTTQVFSFTPDLSVRGLQTSVELRLALMDRVFDLFINSSRIGDHARFLGTWRSAANKALMERRTPAIDLAVTSASIVLATGNKNKLAEHRLILGSPEIGPSPVLINQSDFGLPEVAETCSTLSGNATLKSYAIAKDTKLPALSDDTGLFVSALGGKPGVYTARYAGSSATSSDVNRKILEELRSAKDRTATLNTAASLADPSGPLGDTVVWVVASLAGSIADFDRPSNPELGGWGLDPIFVPNDLRGDTQTSVFTMADLPVRHKLRLSHRGRAFSAMHCILNSYLVACSVYT